MAEKRAFLIDGNSQAYQAYYAIKTGMTSPEGYSTNAVYGFTTMLLKIIREKKPDYIAVAFDTAAPTFRHEAFADYKAQRKPMPDDLVAQMSWIREILDAYSVPVFAVEGYEADDVLGTLARLAAEKSITAVIVTRDKDAMQLLGEHVVMWDNKGDQFFTADDLREKLGIEPGQVIEMMALSGDAVDNVPGVPGVGPKTALSLIQKYGTLENALAHADEAAGPKLRQNLVQHAAEARMSRDLVIIDTHMPLSVDFEKLRLQAGDKRRLAELFRRFDFRSLLPTVAETSSDSSVRYVLVDTEESLRTLAEALAGADAFAFDTETTGLSPVDSRLVGMSFAVREEEAFYVPVMCPLGEKCLPPEMVLAAVAPALRDPAKRKTGQNLKYDYIAMRQVGIEVAGIDFDTMVASYLVDPGRHGYNLESLAADYLSYKMIPIEDLIGKGRTQTTLDTIACARVAQYSGEDAQVSLRLANCLRPELARLEQEKLFRELEMPLVGVLARMEASGVLLDREYLAGMSVEFEADINALEERIYREAGHQFNISSPVQLAKVLFEERNLQAGKRTKTGYSTDIEVLEKLADNDALAALVLEYRSLTKLKGTYIDALPRMVSLKDGRIHCSFNQTGTVTGRLSSSDPNLQNIPIRTELGRRIRRAFVVEPGWVMVSADYSQIELRLAAHLSGDDALIRAFNNGEDIHNFVAREIYGVAEKDVTGEMRRTAKAVNFGIIYGQSPYGLSRQLGIPIGEAAAFIDSYFARYPGVEAYIMETLKVAMDRGYVSTMLGRRRYISGIEASSPRNLNSSERVAVNATIQGSAADMIKRAMIAIDRRHGETGSPAKMLLQIHDELVFEMPREMLADEAARIEREMADAISLVVPVVVNIASGSNWLEAEK